MQIGLRGLSLNEQMNESLTSRKTEDTDAVIPLEQWFVMRDLTRPNAKLPAYRLLAERGIECFTPMVPKLLVRHGKQEREEVPFIHDLLFVHASRGVLDPIVEKISTFQYRYLRKPWREPMTVRAEEMNRFIRAVCSVESPRYYRPDEITPEMYRRKIRIMGGELEGFEGYLLSVRGSKTKRLLVELSGLLAASVEVEPEYVQLLNS